MSRRGELLGLGAAGVAAGLSYAVYRALRQHREAARAVPTSHEAATTALPPAPTTLTAAETDRLFGPLPWRSVAGDDSAIEIDPAWTAANFVKVEIPELRGVKGAPADGRVTLHRAVADRVVDLFAAWERAGLASRITSWAGSFNPRRIRGRETVSKHAYAIAWDLNAAESQLGQQAAQRGAPGSLVELVPAAVQHGFTWGGYWTKRPDPMHFEAFR